MKKKIAAFLLTALFLSSSNATETNPVAQAIAGLLGGPSTSSSIAPLLEVGIFISNNGNQIGYTVSCKMRDGSILHNSCAGGGFTSGSFWLPSNGPSFYPGATGNINFEFIKVVEKQFNQCQTTDGSIINFHAKSVSEQIPIDGTPYRLNYSSNYNEKDPANQQVTIGSPFAYNQTLPDFDVVVVEAANGYSKTIFYENEQFTDEVFTKGKQEDLAAVYWDGISGNTSANIFVSKLNYSVGFGTKLTPDSVGTALDEAGLSFYGLLDQYSAIFGTSRQTLYLDTTVSYYAGEKFIGAVSNVQGSLPPTPSSPVGELALHNKALTIYRPTVWGLNGWTIDAHHYFDLSSKALYRGDGSVDTYNNVLSYNDPLTNQQVYYVPDKNNKENYFVFDQQGKHLYTRNLTIYAKYLLKFNYTSDFKLASIEDIHGNTTHFVNGQSGTTITAPFGQQTTLVSENENLIRVENSMQKNFEMTYDQTGRLWTFKSLSGEITEFLYDASGKFYAEIKNTGIMQNLMKSVVNGLKTLQVTMGWGLKLKQEIVKTLDGEQTVERNADGTVQFTIRSFNGHDTEVQTVNETSTTYYQDSPIWANDIKELKKIETVRDSILGSSVNSLNFGGDISIARPDNFPPYYAFYDRVNYYPDRSPFHEEYRANLARRIVLRRDGHPETVIMYLNEAGQVLSIEKSNQAMVTFEYNSLGQLAKKTIQNTFETYTYDSFGFLETITTSNGQVTTFENDPQGKVKVKTLPNGDRILFEYTDAGEIKKIVTPSSQPHSFQFGIGDYLNTYLAPSSSTTYDYDEHKRLSKITKPGGKQVQYTYQSGFNRLSSITTPEGNYSFQNYNSRSQPHSITSPDNIKLELSYFGSDLQGQKWLDEDGSEIGSLAFKYHASLPVIEQILLNGDVVANLGYRANLTISNINELGLNPGASLVDFGINGMYGTYSHTADARSFLTAYFGDNVISVARIYDNFALARGYTQYSRSNGQYNSYSVQTPVYDANNRLMKVQRESKGYVNGQLVGSQDFENQYIYPQNSNNNLAEFIQTIGTATTPAKRTLATYANDDRLLSLRGAMQRDYTYDDEGNLSRMSNCYGNTDYIYDVFGNLKKVTLPDGKVVEYKTDALNRRIKKSVNGQVVEYYLWYDKTKLAAILNADKSVKFIYLYSPESDGPSLIIKNGITYKVLVDPGLASVRYVVNTVSKAIVQKVDYDEFGNMLNNTNPQFQPVLYAGGLYDFDTKLYRFGARDYDPTIGRWTTKDPIGFSGGDTNLYAYVGGNPMSYNDPSGLEKMYLNGNNLSIYTDDGKLLGSFGVTSGNSNSSPIQPGLYNVDTANMSFVGYLNPRFWARQMNGDWGRLRVPLNPQFSTKRNGFYMHGGRFPGSAGCVDVGSGNNEQTIFDILQNAQNGGRSTTLEVNQ